MKKALTVVLTALIILSSLPYTAVKASNLYGEYSAYRILTFDSGFEGLQVRINVTWSLVSNYAQSDFSDLRFTDFDSQELLSAWNETTIPEEYCLIWIRLSTSLKICMFYGKSEAGSYWDKEAVFDAVISDVVVNLPFDDGSGSVAYDLSGNGWDGDLIRSPVWDSGVHGGALEFNASLSNYVDVSGFDALNGETEFTFSVYAQAYSLSSYMGISSTIHSGSVRDGVSLHIGTSQRVACLVGDNGGYTYFGSVDSAVASTWYYMTVVHFANDTVKFYVDGVYQTEGTQTVLFDSGHLTVGRLYYDSSAYDLSGLVDDFLIVGDSLNASQVLALAQGFGDCSIITGECLVREWVDVAPTASIGIEASYDELQQNSIEEIWLYVLLTMIVALFAVILIVSR